VLYNESEALSNEKAVTKGLLNRLFAQLEQDSKKIQPGSDHRPLVYTDYVVLPDSDFLELQLEFTRAKNGKFPKSIHTKNAIAKLAKKSVSFCMARKTLEEVECQGVIEPRVGESELFLNLTIGRGEIICTFYEGPGFEVKRKPSGSIIAPPEDVTLFSAINSMLTDYVEAVDYLKNK
jgi:hypothetical protein